MISLDGLTVELGVSALFNVISYQIIENDLIALMG